MNRMRLIDGDALKEYFFRPYSNEESYSNIDIAHIIDNQPTISPSAQPDYTAIKYEIQRNIDDFYNSKHHAQHISNNGRMIAFGLELALDIVKDVERKNDGEETDRKTKLITQER